MIQGDGGREDDETRHSPEKVLSVCRLHHGHIHDRPEVSYDLGYMLRTGTDPEEQPVWYPAEGCWYQLTASGLRLAYLRPAPVVAIR